MQFKPRTEEEVRRVFEKGEYPFKIIDSIEKTSKNGNPMIELNLELYHTKIKGKTNLVKCYLMSSEPNFEFLIRHFCYSIGLGQSYEAGNIVASTLVGKEGIALIGIEVDKTGQYPDKNRVLDFILSSATPIYCLDNDLQKKENTLSDDIPF